MSTERIKGWKRSELGENEDSSRETSYHVSKEFVWVWLCGCDCVGEEGSVWVGQPVQSPETGSQHSACTSLI